MSILVIGGAFISGLVARGVHLPPMVGYLAAGFVLHAFGQETTSEIEAVADVGVLILLFGIGLKVRFTTLVRPEVWGSAVLHLGVSIIVLGAAILSLGAVGVSLAMGLSFGTAATLGFAFSFSSTVFAAKALEETGEMGSLPGRIAMGILIVQDLVAVAFIAIAADVTPSKWALPVVAATVLARPVYGWLLDRTGHGELLTLFGFSLALGVGAAAFEHVGLKADLGALVLGLLLARHDRATELSEQLLGIKDLLLIGFFLSIGLGGTPSLSAVVVAGTMLVILPAKLAAFVLLLTRFRLRSRTAWHASVSLGTYSEFGLLVVANAVAAGSLDRQWISAMAVAVAASFVAASPLSSARFEFFRRRAEALGRLERHPLRDGYAPFATAGATMLVLGMGRIGSGAYDELVARRGAHVLGVDRSEEVVAANIEVARRVVRGDAVDREFWEALDGSETLDLVVLAMGDHHANVETSRRVREFLPRVHIAASATYSDQVQELIAAGADVVRNLYAEAGQGLAADACEVLDGEQPEDTVRSGD